MGAKVRSRTFLIGNSQNEKVTTTLLAAVLMLLPMSRTLSQQKANQSFTWLEKSWGLIAVVLYLENRISSQVLALGLIDLLFGVFFVCAYIATNPGGQPEYPAEQDHGSLIPTIFMTIYKINSRKCSGRR
jgi:hypothetical protein